MFKKLLLAVLAFTALNYLPALACDDQVGQTIFEDTFADDSGGWEAYGKVVPPEFIIQVSAGSISNWVYNQTFSATQGDYCMQFKMPPSIAPDNQVAVGIVSLGLDNDNYYLFEVFSNKRCALFKRAKSGWSAIWTVNDCSLKTEPDAVNTLRETVKDGKITAYVNGTQVKAVRAQIPTDQLKFGFYVQIDAKTDKPVEFKVTKYRVTTGQ